jgi:hypothetical protein
MRRRKSIFNWLLPALVGLSILGCIKGRSVPGETTSQPQEVVPPRRFDPLDLPADVEIVPLKYPQTGALRGKEVSKDTAGIPFEDTSVVISLPDEIDTLAHQAYRVQIFTSKVYGEARRALRVAEEIFDRPLSLDYEVPYYKVRVGRFADRGEAEAYAQKARAAGYKNAWVVMVNVDIKEVQPFYEDESALPNMPDTIFYNGQTEGDE